MADSHIGNGGDGFDALIATPLWSDFENIVTLVVGPEKRIFSAHMEVLAKKSEFFRTMFRRAWAKNVNQRVDLPTHDAATFSLFVAWAYGDKNIFEQVGSSRDVILFTIRLYILGDRLLSKEFCEAAEEKLRWKSGANVANWGSVLINYAFDNLSSDSPLRDTILDLVKPTSTRQQCFDLELVSEDFKNALLERMIKDVQGN